MNKWHVLVTRPESGGEALCQLIEANGDQATHFPTMAFASPSDADAQAQALATLAEQTWIIFISPQAVYSSVPLLRRQWPHLPDTVKFAAVGQGTAKALKAAGYVVQAIPSAEWSSEGLLALPEFQVVAKQRITIVRGEGGRSLLENVFKERGALVTSLVTYQRVLPSISVEPYLALLKQQRIHAIVCSSFEGVKNLKILLGDDGWSYLQSVPLVVMSERIKKLAHDLGFQTIWVAKTASNEAIVEVLAQQRKE